MLGVLVGLQEATLVHAVSVMNSLRSVTFHPRFADDNLEHEHVAMLSSNV